MLHAVCELAFLSCRAGRGRAPGSVLRVHSQGTHGAPPRRYRLRRSLRRSGQARIPGFVPRGPFRLSPLAMNQPSGRGGPAIPTGTEGNGRGCQQAACVVCALSGRVVALLLHCCGCRATVGRCCLQGPLDSAVCVLSSSVTSGIELSCVCCCCAREVAFWYSLGPPSHGAPALKPAALGTACGPDLPEFL